jgi:hypothetical protein
MAFSTVIEFLIYQYIYTFNFTEREKEREIERGAKIDKGVNKLNDNTSIVASS